MNTLLALLLLEIYPADTCGGERVFVLCKRAAVVCMNLLSGWRSVIGTVTRTNEQTNA